MNGSSTSLDFFSRINLPFQTHLKHFDMFNMTFKKLQKLHYLFFYKFTQNYESQIAC